jgi:hypothetical protein
MAGYTKTYVVGGEGGFMGADGINPLQFFILVGDGNRQWLEVHYVEEGIRPIGRIKKIIPEGPDHPNALIDACIAFYPALFKSCPSLPLIEKKLANEKMLDFHAREQDIPEEWSELREEARPLFTKLNLWKAVFENDVTK